MVPIYEYLCEACGRLTEVMQKITDRPPRQCPECGSRRLAKLVSRTAFQLKGGGWYADLYGTPKKKEAESPAADKAAAPGERSPSDQASAPAKAAESVPAAKADRAVEKKPKKGA